MNKKYRVRLTPAEREELAGLLARGKADVRRLKHAHILLELSALVGQCLWPRSARQETLVSRVARWQADRNAAEAKVK